MKNQKLHIALEGTYNGDVTGGLAMTEANLQALFILKGGLWKAVVEEAGGRPQKSKRKLPKNIPFRVIDGGVKNNMPPPTFKKKR